MFNLPYDLSLTTIIRKHYKFTMPEDIVLCPVCKGWGFKQLPVDSDLTPCDYCAGKSVQYNSEEYYLSWDIPPYIDYGKRARNKTKRLIIMIGLIVALLIILAVLIYLFNNTLNAK